MKNEHGQFIDYTDIYFYLCRDGGNWVRFRVDCFFYHPKHNDDPWSGFDYGIGFLVLPYEKKRPGFNVKNYPASDELIMNSKTCFIGEDLAPMAKGCDV